MEPIFYASKFGNWETQYSWDTCKTGREEFGRFIADFLTTESRVINLNGAYGSGKTEFIRRIYIELAKQKHPVIYIDAWESDFSNNPLAVICSEILQQIEFIFKEQAPNGEVIERNSASKIINKLKQDFGHCLNYIEAGALFTGEPMAIAASKAVSKVVNATSKSNTQTNSQKLVEAVQKNHMDAVQAIKDIKESITFLSELIEIVYGLNTPIVILIDELDRCRPTYAIEVLESIKHFFETKGCTFLVATNTEVLECSVQSVYGKDFDAQLYLRRFFDRKITLPQVSLLGYLNAKEFNFEKYKEKNLTLYPFYEDQKDNIALFSALFEDNNLELRDVEQILNRFFAGLDYVAKHHLETEVILNTVILLAGLLEQHLDVPITKHLAKKNNYGGNFALVFDGPNCDKLNYTVNSMIDCMSKCVTIVWSKTIHSGGGNSVQHQTDQEILRIRAEDYAKLKIPFEDGQAHIFFNKIIHDFSRTDCKYLMWEEHQMIIELSGHIE